MSILIKGMKMPKNCMLCSFCVEEADPANGEMCLVTGKLMPPCNHERLDDCPLIEVPPHGRLIDADAVERNLVKMQMAQKNVVAHGIRKSRAVVRDMATVITAEESNMDSFIRIFEEDDEEDGMDSFIRILKD